MAETNSRDLKENVQGTTAVFKVKKQKNNKREVFSSLTLRESTVADVSTLEAIFKCSLNILPVVAANAYFI